MPVYRITWTDEVAAWRGPDETVTADRYDREGSTYVFRAVVSVVDTQRWSVAFRAPVSEVAEIREVDG